MFDHHTFPVWWYINILASLMKTHNINPLVADAIASYPDSIHEKILLLRELILLTAEQESPGKLEETIKWGEPSYLVKGGSTIRIAWKPTRPQEYAMYFHCKTKLVDTFREIYGNKFSYEGNRAICFHEQDEVPVKELKHCILLSLTYHERKHLPLLGG